MTALEANRRRMVAILSEITTGEGLRPSALDGVSLARADREHPRAPVLYEPSIFIVANGRKTGFLGERRFIYDPNNYLVLSVPLPFECITEPGTDGPMLGISVRVTPSMVSDLAVRMQSRPASSAVGTTGYVEATPLDAAMSDAALRLVECLRSPVDTDILGPGVVREIVYRALCGPQGHLLLEMVGRHGQAAQINAALRWMHSRYNEPFSVARMAAQVGMSVSAFHHQFKALTTSSPVQYLKSVRLHKAWALIVDEGYGAAEAALAVGYESASQFSREFKRFFGATPSEAARQVRTLAATAAARRPEARAS